MLPEDVLLEIFDWHINDEYEHILIHQGGAWQELAHVCRKWRNVVFGSSHRLNLRLVCTDKKPVRKMLDIWPSFPIIISSFDTLNDGGNIVAALEHNDRVCDIYLGPISSSLWEKIMAEMQEPFPALRHLNLNATNEADVSPIDPASFLGGSAPDLRHLYLGGIPFPGLPKLLSSATHL